MPIALAEALQPRYACLMSYMRLGRTVLIVLGFALTGCQPSPQAASQAQTSEIRRQALTPTPDGLAPLTPIARFGQLRVTAGRITGAQGETASLAGPSFFWSNTDWGMARFYNQSAVAYFAQDWNAGIVRAAIAGEHDGSYLDQPSANMARAQAIIEGAIASGVYVVVDWHSHHAERHAGEAQQFFRDIAAKYGHIPNLIYEIYNEPLDTTDWNTVVKPYAERMIRAIREIDPDNLIIVGTQSWSQDVDKAARNPIIGYENIGYSLHFYAGTHGEQYRRKAERAIQAGLPIMVTEWGSVDHTGDGEIDRASTEAWLAFIRRHGLSHMIWSVSDKREGAAMLHPGVRSDGGWVTGDLTESGRYARHIIRNWDAD